MIKPSLLVLAAGMGSRYGSLKQMDGIGPNNEAIIDYSVYDAIRAGFGKVVFVIRHSFEKEFREIFNTERFGGKIGVEFVFQELDSLPEGFTVPEGRVKPWGTNHAMLMARGVINEPFAIINADDFYGANAYIEMARYLTGLEGSRNHYCMVGYELSKTLSEHGTVSRGVCETNDGGYLTRITEHLKISRENGRIVSNDEVNGYQILPDNTPVSMNMFGFTPDYFDYSADYFVDFLKKNADNLKAEFFTGFMINHLIATKTADMKVLSTGASWFGVTYKEDKPMVERNLRELIDAGVYPEQLWK